MDSVTNSFRRNSMGELPKVGQIFDAKYRIEAVLGSGGFGTVFKACQLDCNRVVALKVLHGAVVDENDKARFLREAKTLSKLSHANIVEVYHLGVSASNLPYLAMEYVVGESLRSLMRADQRLSVIRCLKLMKNLAQTMAYVHKNNIVHRDLKPENIIILQTPAPDSIKLLDFGLVKLIQDDEQHSSIDTAAESADSAQRSTLKQKLTSTGQMLGSITYMSPEQCLGKQTDARSDIYAFTVIVYEMVCGKLPFDADNPVGMAYKHINEPVPKVVPADVDVFHPQLDHLFAKGMAKEPDKRFGSMSELADEIDLLIEYCGSAPRGLSTPVANRLFLWSLGALLAAGGVCVFGFLKKQPSTKQPSIVSKVVRPTMTAVLDSAGYKRKLASIEKEYDANSKDLAINLKILADKMEVVDKNESLRLYRRALDICEKTLPPGDPLTTILLTNYGGGCVTVGKTAEAIPCLEKAIATMKNPPSGALSRIRAELVRAYLSTKQYDKAASVCASFDSSLDLTALGIIMAELYKGGKTKEADSLFRRVLAGREDDLPTDAIAPIMEFVPHQKNVDERLMDFAIAIQRTSKLNETASISQLVTLSEVRLRQNKRKEALDLLNLAVKKVSRTTGSADQLHGAFEGLGLGYSAAGEYQLAQKYFEKGRQCDLAASVALGRSQNAYSYYRLASVLDAQHKNLEAEAVIIDGIKSMEKDKHTDIQELQQLRKILADRGIKLPEAESTYAKVPR